VKIKDDKKPNRKRRKSNKTLSQKAKRGKKKLDKKAIKEKEPKIKVQQQQQPSLLFPSKLG
jgi:hypothetical protein